MRSESFHSEIHNTCLKVLLVIALVSLSGCQWLQRFQNRGHLKPLISPYEAQRIWAVLPVQNESGYMLNHEIKISQDLVKHLESAGQIEVWPMSRTIDALSQWQHTRLSKPEEAAALMRHMGVDGLVVTSLTSYDPYDPPRMGMAIELYLAETALGKDVRDVRALVRAATDPRGVASGYSADQTFHIAQASHQNGRPILVPGLPVSTVSLILDARDRAVDDLLGCYVREKGMWPEDRRASDAVHRYQVSMPLYQDFVTYEVVRRLLDAEWRRFEQIEWMAAMYMNEQQSDSSPLSDTQGGRVRKIYQQRSHQRAIKRRY